MLRGMFFLFLAQPEGLEELEGLHYASNIVRASNITSIENLLISYHFKC